MTRRSLATPTRASTRTGRRVSTIRASTTTTACFPDSRSGSTSPRARPDGFSTCARRATTCPTVGTWPVATEPERPAEHSLSGFLTTRFVEWLDRQESGWFAHLSYLRPHPPYAAAGEFSTHVRPGGHRDADRAGRDADERHWVHDAALNVEASAAPTDPDQMRALARPVLRDDQ